MISSLLPGVIAANVTALGLDVRSRETLTEQSLVELRQPVAGKIDDGADFFPDSPLDPGGRVELAHSDNLDTVSLAVLGDGLEPKRLAS